ncbi:MAG: transcriptional regulator [Armatimonadetes bacterium]|nr:transcriptional regulator [Armatimonadota bacterium]
MATLEQLKAWMADREHEHIEFKEAKNRFDFDELVRYCCALANERGGHLILGVTDKRPRRVVGSRAFTNLERTKLGLHERLRLRIEAEVLAHPDGPVIVFTVPSRPIGTPIGVEGAFWMRVGESLTPMSPDALKKIIDESGLDFSSEICPKATLQDLDDRAVNVFREKWKKKSGDDSIGKRSKAQTLEDAELIVDGQITYAALILLGTRPALGRLLPNAELIFEYRTSESATHSQQRKEHREGFFLWHDEVWDIVNLRNDTHKFQDQLFVWDIPTFNETAIREVILNAVSHRDYKLGGSIFMRQYPKRLEVVSPGGLPLGITTENILKRQNPRNRRIAEAFGRTGLVERSGQWMDRIFGECIRESKRRPDFNNTDQYQVSLSLSGEVRDPKFLAFLEQVNKDLPGEFHVDDLLVLDLVYKSRPIPLDLRERISRLREGGIVEGHGKGRSTKYTLSRRFYHFLGKKGAYTRARGLDSETQKELLLRHINDNQGCKIGELWEVLPELSRGQVRGLLADIRKEGRAHPRGRTAAGRWFTGPEAADIE